MWASMGLWKVPCPQLSAFPPPVLLEILCGSEPPLGAVTLAQRLVEHSEEPSGAIPFVPLLTDQLSCSSVVDWKFQCLPPMELELQRQWPWRTQSCPHYFTGAGSQGLFSWVAKRHCPTHFPDLCPEWTHLPAQLIWTSLFPTSFLPIADPCCFLSAATHNLRLPTPN